MRQQEGKVSAELLFIAAILLLVGAVYIYITREDHSYKQIEEGVKNHNAATERVEKQHKELVQKFAELNEWQTRHLEMTDKLSKRMEMIEMRMDAATRNRPPQVVHKDAPIPQPLKVEITQPVEFIPRKVPPKGKQNDKPARK